MNLRSGATAQESQPKVKRKRKNKTNIPEPEMAENLLEMNIKKMLGDLKEDISKQIGGLRGDFAAFSAELQQVQTEVKEIRSNVDENKTSIEIAQERINELEMREETTNETVRKLLQEHQKVNEKLEYIENKSRQNNIRIYQVKEGAEGGDPVGFIRQLLTEKLDIPSDQLIITAAHRSLTNKPEEHGATPRSFVIRFQEWNTRQKVLKTAWAKKEIKVGENQIFFSQDFSSKIHAERRRYTPIRKILKSRNVRSHIIYPAKLKVFEEGGSTTTFNSPEEAEIHLREKGVIPSTELTIYPPAPKEAPYPGIGLQKRNGAGKVPEAFQKVSRR